MRPILVCALIAGCRQPAAPNDTARPGPRADAAAQLGTGPATFAGVLTAPAAVRSSAELTAHLVITNPGPGELVLTRGAVDLPVLALEVRDARDARVPTIPPPVPRTEDAERIVLAPGQTLERDYPLDVFSPPLAPGAYTLHCNMVACAPRPFTVAP